MSSSILDRNKIRVGVIRGGPSNEYEVSLKTGAHVIKHLPEKYLPIDIFISKDGVWHIDGREKTPAKAIEQVDVIFNALHGKYGEDGKVQTILDTFKKPYTGSTSLASAVGMHKGFAKAVFGMSGIKTPVHLILSPKDNTEASLFEVFKTFPNPSVIKPVSGGSSLAIVIAKDLISFKKGIENAFRHGGAVLIEEYLFGREATCGVIGASDGKTSYALFPVEIVPPKHKDFFDYDAKYGEETEEICPSTFSDVIKKDLQELAVSVHRSLGFRHYSRTDFIVTPNRGIYVLESNSLPGLTSVSLYPRSLEAAGISMSEFLDHILTIALR